MAGHVFERSSGDGAAGSGRAKSIVQAAAHLYAEMVEYGRHAALRGQWAKAYGGSSPPLGIPFIAEFPPIPPLNTC